MEAVAPHPLLIERVGQRKGLLHLRCRAVKGGVEARHLHENANCSGSSQLAPSSGFSACTPPSTTPSISNAISSHARRSGPSERGGKPMEKCGYCSVIACSARGYFCSIFVNLTMPAVDVTGSGAGATAQWPTAVCGCRTFGANQSSWCAHLIIAVTKPSAAILLLIRGNPCSI